MLRAWKLFWITLWSILFGAVAIKNLIKYKDQPIWWNIGKSVLDVAIIVLSALFLPAFLVATNVAWVVNQFDQRWLKLVSGVLSGIIFGLIAAYAIEFLILLGIFSVDIKTGPDKGVIYRWRQTQEKSGDLLAA